MKKKDKKSVKAPVFDRPVEKYFYELDQSFAQQRRGLYAFFLTLLFFGVMGLIWMIPFPQLAILERMNAQTFLNWGSFYIAILIYFYLRLAPTLSYAMLFSIAVISFFIVQLEYVERDGGPAVWFVCLLISLAGLGGVLFLASKESTSLQPKKLIQFVTVGPIWLWSKAFQRFNIKY